MLALWINEADSMELPFEVQQKLISYVLSKYCQQL